MLIPFEQKCKFHNYILFSQKMQLLIFTLIIAVASASLEIPANLEWLGKGYNILDGNPEGESAEFGTTDPGIRGRIFEVSYYDHNLSTDGKY